MVILIHLSNFIAALKSNYNQILLTPLITIFSSSSFLVSASRQCISKLLSFEETPDAAPWVSAYRKLSFFFCLIFLILICLLLACSSQINITGVIRKMGQFVKCIYLQENDNKYVSKSLNMNRACCIYPGSK